VINPAFTFYTRARYYDFDADYLIEMESQVRHYNLYTASSAATLDAAVSRCEDKPPSGP
jgi:hypothetical protein